MPVDAYAYLIRHGWSGPGNPLNPDGAGARGGLGLTKPLLVARRSGNSGVGNKTTKDPTNQWWLRGFEDALKGIGTGNATGETGAGMKGNALTSELYRFFVKGEGVPGTIGGVKSGMEDKGGGKKRKREEEEEEGESKEGRKLRNEEKRRRKIEKRERRRERKERKMKKAEVKAERKKRKAEEKKEKKPAEDYPTPVSMDLDSTDAQEGGSSLDTEKLEKLKKKEKDKKEKERKKDKSLKEGKKSKRESTSDESSKRKSKKSKST
ncbi:hypothetical protein BDW62DRAFT_201406 [Aspergillus aurantiobrunneus]